MFCHCCQIMFKVHRLSNITLTASPLLPNYFQVHADRMRSFFPKGKTGQAGSEIVTTSITKPRPDSTSRVLSVPIQRPEAAWEVHSANVTQNTISSSVLSIISTFFLEQSRGYYLVFLAFILTKLCCYLNSKIFCFLTTAKTPPPGLCSVCTKKAFLQQINSNLQFLNFYLTFTYFLNFITTFAILYHYLRNL